MNNKKIVIIFSFLILFGFIISNINYSNAVFMTFGYTITGASSVTLNANCIIAINITITGNDYQALSFNNNLKTVSGVGNCKFILFNSTLDILQVTDSFSINSSNIKRSLDVSDLNIILYEDITYCLGFICDVQTTVYHDSTGASNMYWQNNTNSYITPEKPTTVSFSSNQYYINTQVIDYTSPTPTPSPTPYPTIYHYQISPTPNFTVYNYMTSAHINQSQNYVYTGTLTSAYTPYGSAVYSVYTTSILSGSLNNNTIRDTLIDNLGLTDIESLTLNTSGTFSLNGNGEFNFNILLNYEYNSICKYQGYKVNGTIPSTGEIFTSYVIIEALEPDSDSIITVYLNGGSTVNMLLSTQLNFNQIAYNTQYNASGFVYTNGVPYTDNDTIIVSSTVVSINQISVKNLPFSNSITLTSIEGQFTFLITPQIYNVMPSYQGIRITQPTLGITTTYWIEYVGLGTTVFPTPYPTSSSSIINPTPTSSLDITQYTVMFFLIFMPPLFLAGLLYELASKTSLQINPVIGFFLGCCVMVPIGYMTPYNGSSLVPLWMLFIFVAGLIVSGILLFKDTILRTVT